jgi:hypothetical protein
MPDHPRNEKSSYAVWNSQSAFVLLSEIRKQLFGGRRGSEKNKSKDVFFGRGARSCLSCRRMASPSTRNKKEGNDGTAAKSSTGEAGTTPD